MSLAELGEQPGKVETIIQQAPYLSDPLAAFSHICAASSHALLLESAEIDSKDDLQSLLMVDAALRIECRHETVIVTALTENGKATLPLFSEQCPAQASCTLNETSAVMKFSLPDSTFDEDSRLKAASVFDALRLVVNHIVALR